MFAQEQSKWIKGVFHHIFIRIRLLIIKIVLILFFLPWDYKNEEIIKILDDIRSNSFKILPEGSPIKYEIKAGYDENLFAVPEEIIGIAGGDLLGLVMWK